VKYKSGGSMAKALKSTTNTNENITIFVIIGADTAIKYPYSIKTPSIIVDRGDLNLKIRNLIRKERRMSHDSRIFDLFMCEKIPGEVSSTMLRKAIQEGNEDVVNKMCSPALSKYLNDNKNDLWEKSMPEDKKQCVKEAASSTTELASSCKTEIGGMNKKYEVAGAQKLVSRLFTQILRHTAEENGLEPQTDGFLSLDSLLSCKAMLKTGMKLTYDDVDKLVREDLKGRFATKVDKDGKRLIRTNQGHSGNKVVLKELCGEPIKDLEEGEVCIHGTKFRFLNSIINSDLKAGGTQGLSFRMAIHMTTSPPGKNERSGVRKNSEILIYIDAKRAIQEGVDFYRSQNNVLLTQGKDGKLSKEYKDRQY